MRVNSSITSFHPLLYAVSNGSIDAMVDDRSCRRSLHEIVLGSTVTLVITLTSILGNTAVVTVSLLDNTLKVQTGNILIAYLALTDIMTSLFVMLPSAIAVACDNWPLGMGVCRINATFNYMFFCSSSFNISLISLDRMVAVLYPLKHTAWMTTRLMVGFCLWLFLPNLVIGLLCSLHDWIKYDYNEAVCTVNYSNSGYGLKLLAATGSTACFWAPAFVMGICNAIIIVTANRSRRMINPLFVRRRTLSSEFHMRKTIKSLLVVVLTYYVCYTPYTVTKLAKVQFGIETPLWFDYATTILVFIASATNPFIYGIFRKDYREAFKKLLKMMFKKCPF